jgi:hypothetical protein
MWSSVFASQQYSLPTSQLGHLQTSTRVMRRPALPPAHRRSRQRSIPKQHEFQRWAVRFAEIAGSNDIPRDHPFAKVRPGSGLSEMWDIEERNSDRYLLNHGVSGAPIVDCEGNVAAVASNIGVFRRTGNQADHPMVNGKQHRSTYPTAV